MNKSVSTKRISEYSDPTVANALYRCLPDADKRQAAMVMGYDRTQSLSRALERKSKLSAPRIGFLRDFLVLTYGLPLESNTLEMPFRAVLANLMFTYQIPTNINIAGAMKAEFDWGRERGMYESFDLSIFHGISYVTMTFTATNEVGFNLVDILMIGIRAGQRRQEKIMMGYPAKDDPSPTIQRFGDPNDVNQLIAKRDRLTDELKTIEAAIGVTIMGVMDFEAKAKVAKSDPTDIDTETKAATSDYLWRLKTAYQQAIEAVTDQIKSRLK